MPLSLPSMNAAIVCDGKGVGNVRFEARGCVIADSIHRKRGWKGESVFHSLGPTSDRPITNRRGTNLFAIQQFEITFSNNLTNFENLRV